MIKEIIKTFKNYSVDKDPANDCLDVHNYRSKIKNKKNNKKIKKYCRKSFKYKIILMPTYTVKYSNINLSQKQKFYCG